MSRTIITVCFLAVSAGPALADTIVIDDDSWSRVESPAAVDRTVDVDDDGWRWVDAPRVERGRTASSPGVCTQMERSARVASADCGKMDRGGVIDRLNEG